MVTPPLPPQLPPGAWENIDRRLLGHERLELQIFGANPKLLAPLVLADVVPLSASTISREDLPLAEVQAAIERIGTPDSDGFLALSVKWPPSALLEIHVERSFDGDADFTVMNGGDPMWMDDEYRERWREPTLRFAALAVRWGALSGAKLVALHSGADSNAADALKHGAYALYHNEQCDP